MSMGFSLREFSLSHLPGASVTDALNLGGAVGKGGTSGKVPTRWWPAAWLKVELGEGEEYQEKTDWERVVPRGNCFFKDFFFCGFLSIQTFEVSINTECKRAEAAVNSLYCVWACTPSATLGDQLPPSPSSQGTVDTNKIVL